MSSVFHCVCAWWLVCSGRIGRAKSLLRKEKMPRGVHDDVMKRAVTESPAMYHSRVGAVDGSVSRIQKAKEARKETRSTLRQWGGMKRVKMSDELQEELNLLQYRSLINKKTARVAPKVDADGSGGAASEFFEVGYIGGAGSSRRRRRRGFAEEWLRSDPTLAAAVTKEVTRETRRNKRQKRKDERRANAKRERERGRRGRGNADSDGDGDEGNDDDE